MISESGTTPSSSAHRQRPANELLAGWSDDPVPQREGDQLGRRVPRTVHDPLACALSERRLIQERAKAELASARARGRLGRRPPIGLDEAKVRAASKLHEDHTLNIDDICTTLQNSKSTCDRYVQLNVRK
jgi:hypothetical protein